MEVSHYDQAIHLNPNLDPAYASRGLFRSDLGDKKGALSPYFKPTIKSRIRCAISSLVQ
jgi:hypothetical protein